jgi:5-methylcytosine-specific restriction endonuclease McrA
VNLRGQERTEFPLSVRKAAFKRCCRDGKPYCESCPAELGPGNIIYEHIVPDGLGGQPTLENCKVHCRNCADVKTFTEDNPRMQKADRVLKKNYGLTRKKAEIRSPGFPQRAARRPIGEVNKWRGYAGGDA